MVELPRATSRYVVLGLLILVAVTLALRSALLPSSRGEPDEWMRVLVVRGPKGLDFHSNYYNGFEVTHEGRYDVVAEGRRLLDDPNADPLTAAITYADERGFGFLVVRGDDSWGLGPCPSVSSPCFAAISIGDVARIGGSEPPHINLGVPEVGPFAYVHPSPYSSEHDLLDTTGIQLALVEHPDLRALFERTNGQRIEGELAKRSRWALDQGRGHQYRREVLQAQQRRLSELEAHWPSPRPGELADRWEQVRAVPVPGGVLIQRRPIWMDVAESVREAVLRSDGAAFVEFVPSEALAEGAAPALEDAARRDCSGLRERDGWKGNGPEFGFAVSPDGRAFVLSHNHESYDLYRIEVDDDACTLDWRGMITITGKRKRKPFDAVSLSNAGVLTVHAARRSWWRAVDRPATLYELAGKHAELAWASDHVLALLGEPSSGAVSLLRTDVDAEGGSASTPRALFDVLAVMPELRHSKTKPTRGVLEIHPAGDDALFVVTSGCPSSHALGFERQERRCVHRVGFRRLLDKLGDAPMSSPLGLDHRDLDVDTLGPIDTHARVAIASDGSRLIHVRLDDDAAPRKQGLFAVDIRDGELGPARRIADVQTDARLIIGADGGVAVVEESVSIVEHNTLTLARAFVLAP